MRGNGATPEELEALYREHFESFVRVATAIAGDAEAGRDAVQAAFVSAMRSRRTFRRESRLQGWVWTIVVNEARRARRGESTLPLDALPEIDDRPGTEPLDDVRRFVAGLPTRQREAVFLRYFADLDYRAIASVLGLEPGTVSATLSAAHQTLRKRLEASRP